MSVFKKISLLLVSFCFLFLFNCNDDSSNTNEISKITVRLVDNPGDFDNVYVEVVDVMVKVNDDSEDDSSWESINPINTGIYDLLDLTGGVSVLLAEDYEVPSGMLNQIRLVLGNDNSIVIDGESYPLNTPSGQQSGLKVKVNQELESGFEYDFVLDFDAEESIVLAGNSGNINLKPVIYASVEASSGRIEGIVSPTDFQVTASVTVDDEEISAYTDENGNYVLYGIPEGTYALKITPDPTSGYSEIIIENIEVINGQVTIVDEVTFE